MGRPLHFEIHVDDMERGRRFYEKVFGWSFQKWGDVDYYVITTGDEGTPGINGGMMPRQGGSGDKVIGWIVTVGVDNLDTTLSEIEANGGSLALPKQRMEGVGWVAYAKDTEENIFGMIQDFSEE
ncbi:MAG TPA: VOC family protein [Acidimicrobiia bacterium]|jgi:predicted enzyme related to lactoylglutathione lyase